MTNSFSVYLDLTRFTAAFLVFVDHLVTYGFFSDSAANWIPQLGREAVIIFFVLSGYVIAYTSDTRNQTWQDYFVARSSRIYSVALPLLLIAFISYAAFTFFWQNAPLNYQVISAYVYVPFHLLFAGELWTLSEVPPWLGAYWSLSYEVWYYILFGVFFFTKGIRRFIAVSAVIGIIGYKLWILAPIWFSGVGLYYLIKHKPLKKPFLSMAIFCLTLILLAIYKTQDLDYLLRNIGRELWPFSDLPLGSADRFLSDYAVTVLIFVNFYTAAVLKIPLNEKISNIIRRFASYTFTLYLLHVVTVSLWTNSLSVEKNSIIHIMGIIVFTGIATVMVGNQTEHKKNVYAAYIKKVLPFLRLNSTTVK